MYNKNYDRKGIQLIFGTKTESFGLNFIVFVNGIKGDLFIFLFFFFYKETTSVEK